jgi:hypothetical protein
LVRWRWNGKSVTGASDGKSVSGATSTDEAKPQVGTSDWKSSDWKAVDIQKTEVTKTEERHGADAPSPADKTKSAKNGKAVDPELVRQVYEMWASTLPPGNRRALIEARKRVIRARLQEFGLQDCLDAARGWPLDPWKDRAQHNDITKLFRPDNFEKFRDLYRNNGQARAPRTPQNTPPLPPVKEWEDDDE